MNERIPTNSVPQEESPVSPEIQKHVDKIIGKGQEKPSSLIYMKARLEAVPSELRESVLENQEIHEYVIDYVTGVTGSDNSRPLSIIYVKARLQSVPPEMIPDVLDDERLRQFIVDRVIGKGQEPKISLAPMMHRLNESAPSELREWLLQN